jgi:hypothetical protein
MARSDITILFPRGKRHPGLIFKRPRVRQPILDRPIRDRKQGRAARAADVRAYVAGLHELYLSSPHPAIDYIPQ